jgi:hypothetical protein
MAMKRVGVLGLLLGAGLVARADPYWITYEGDAFPENDGWRRSYGDEQGPHHGGAVRTIEDGVFVLDSLRHDQIFDYYEIDRLINPAPGELFVAEWRLRVDEPSDFGDVLVVIARDEPPGDVEIDFGTQSVELLDAGGITLGVAPGTFHTYRIESADMVAFDFLVDGQLAYQGVFDDVSLLESFVGFGDSVQGRRSMSRWDYFRFGALPEPTALTGFALGAIVMYGRRARSAGHENLVQRSVT